MKNKNTTIFQRLGQVLSPNYAKDVIPQPTQRYDISDNILKTTNKNEYETAKLQGQQAKYLNNTWKRVENGLFQQSMNYETTRIGSYSDFEAMEFYPIIASALDTVMEESTTVGNHGKILNIYSDSDRVKSILEDLFFNRLDLHTSLPMWVRNTPIRENSMIPLLDGTNISIKDLSKKIKNGEEIWSYAIQDKTHSIVPSKIIWCDLTRKNSELYRVTLDDNTHIDTTPDHEYMLRDGSFKRADKLVAGESLMPFYSKTNINGEETVFNPNSNNYENINDLIIDTIFDTVSNNMVTINHKVLSVQKLDILSDVYCLEAVGPNGEHDRHNFPVLGKDINNTCSRSSGVFLSNCKYGDNFVYLNINDKKGILNAKQMPNYEMERRDGTLFEVINAMEDNNDKTKFYWRGRDLEFNSWQIAHFRLLGDDRRLPYGTSFLEKARRIWKQLILSEDAMLVYRATRAPERRVYKVYVGNIDDADVPAYVNSIADRFKRTPLVDPQTGQIDLKYNQLPVWKKTPIPLLDGRTISIEELAKEYDEGKENWVYSIQDKTHQIVPGKVKWCGLNYKAERLVKVTLDDDTYVVTAEEHPFVMRDGSAKRADELLENDSLMPFYIDEKTFNKRTYGSKYETIYNPGSGKFELTHRLVAKEIEKKKESNTTVHHKNFDSKNNNPTNLEWFDYYEHIAFHGELAKRNWAEGKYQKVIDTLIDYNKSEKKRLRNIELAKEQEWHKRFSWYNGSELHSEHNKIRKEAQLKDWSDPEKKAIRSKNMQIKFDDFIWSSIKTNILSGKIINRKTLIDYLNEDTIIDYAISINNNKRLVNQRRIERTVIERLLVDKGFKTITEYISESKKNHKVKKIEFIGGDDVYCMTVVGSNGEDDRHNFALKSFLNDDSVSESGIFVKNSNDQDYFIPVRSEDAPNPIDTLPGANNLDQIADIEYLRENLFTALRVPKPFLGFDNTTGEGKNLAIQDIRFSRTVNRVQQSMLQELNKIAIIHLYLLGFEDDLDNFTLTLNNPSTQGEILKIEHLQQKVSLFKDAVGDSGNGFGVMSWTRAQREIMGWSDNDIKDDLLQQRMEKAASAELQNTNSVIKHTGTFDVVDRIYGDYEKALKGGESTDGGDNENGSSFSGGLGGSFGGGGTDGEDLDFGDEGDDVTDGDETNNTTEGDNEGQQNDTELSSDNESLNENIDIINNILTERKESLVNKNNTKIKKYKNKWFNLLTETIDSSSSEPTNQYNSVKLVDKNFKINKDIDEIINGIDKILDE